MFTEKHNTVITSVPEEIKEAVSEMMLWLDAANIISSTDNVYIDKISDDNGDGNSIWLRVTNSDNLCKFKKQRFIDFDPNDMEDFEYILHLYKNGKKEYGSYFGRIDSLIDVIKNN